MKAEYALFFRDVWGGEGWGGDEEYARVILIEDLLGVGLDIELAAPGVEFLEGAGKNNN